MVQVNINPTLLDSAKKVFEKEGLSVDEAINLFLDKVNSIGSIPFPSAKYDSRVYSTPKKQIIDSLKESIDEVKRYEKDELKLTSAREFLNGFR